MVRSLFMTAASIALLVPGALRAQCGIDMVEEGIQAYRDLDLASARELLVGAVDLNGRDSSPCATVNARALTYLGATYILGEQPDSASMVFERAVVSAPRFRPDAVEFPPAVTELFDDVREGTPAIATTLPDAVEIGRGGEETLVVRLTASTGHWVEASVRASDGDQIRALYRGPVVTGARGTVVEWDGRDSHGDPVTSGRYDLRIVSLDERADPVRDVTIALTVDSDFPVEVPSTVPAGTPVPETNSDQRWKAVASGGAGLLAGAAVLVMPRLIDGLSGGWVRYPVAGSLGVAGIVGFVRGMDFGASDDLDTAAERNAAAVAAEPDPGPPMIRIRVGLERRSELKEARGTGADAETPRRSVGALDAPAARGEVR